MKKLVIALATAGLFSGAGIVLACDYHQHDAATDANQMMSVGTPTVIANTKPEATAVTSKKATAKTTKKAAAKPDAVAIAVQRN